MFQFLKENPLFTKIANINLLSKIGDRLFYTAMLTTAAALPQSTIGVMVVSISETLPILISFFLGALADQKRHKTASIVKISLFRGLIYLGIGFIFQYQASLTLLLAASVLNFLSDLGGNYGSALISPFTKVLVKTEEMEQAQGYVSLGSQLVNVIATFAGSFLLVLLAKSQLAWLNALVFFLVGILFYRLKLKLKPIEDDLPLASQTKLGQTVKENLFNLFTNQQVNHDIIQLTMINGFFGGLTPIFTLFLKNNLELPSLAASIKISILSGIVTIFMVIGNSLSSKYFRKLSLNQLDLLADLTIVLVGLAFFFNQLYLVFFTNAVLALLLGLISPRFSTKVVNAYPTSRIGGIVTAVNSLLVLAPPLTSILFPALAGKQLSLAYVSFILYGLLLVILASAAFLKRKN